VAELLTVGHGGLDEPAFGGLLRGASVELLVDVRRFPGSRANPAASREVLPSWLPGIGLGYRWEERLGGRRKLPAGDDQDPWWQVAAYGRAPDARRKAHRSRSVVGCPAP
jgi:uncharacterized protein (DUF488 family)